MLYIDHLSHSLDDRPLLTDLSVEVDARRCLAVVGRNGAGKSTLLRCIAGLRHPDAGTITVDGVVADDTDARFRELVAVELGENATFAELTVVEHLRLITRVHGIDESDAEAILADAGLEDLTDRFPHTLSTGQRQRFALCAVFLRPAALVVIDEPEAGLDDHGRGWVVRRIRRATASGAAVVIATHSAQLITACADATLEVGR